MIGGDAAAVERLYDSMPGREWARMDRHRTELYVTQRAMREHLPPPPAQLKRHKDVLISNTTRKERPMTERSSQPIKIDQQLAGPQITAGGQMVQPIARLTGQRNENNGPSSDGAGAWVRLTPIEVVVSGPRGAERHIAVTNPSAQALRQMVGFAAFVAAGSAVLILIARLLGRRG